jgi:general secretion pathway protein G
VRRVAPSRSLRRSRADHPGFTIIELMIAVALIGVLAGLSLTSYLRYVEKARVARSVAEIIAMSKVIDGLTADDDVEMPDSLADVDIATPNDPWGHPYQYLRIQGMGYTAVPVGPPPVAAAGGPGGGGGPAPRPRQDRFLRPINSDYDLYSMGPDGESMFNLSAQVSRDDVVRCLDGAYVGIAEYF